MSPLNLLALVIGLTALAALAQRSGRRRWEGQLSRLAHQWQMNYSPRDQVRLTPKIARHFPVPGAANLKLIDLIYGADGDLHRYIFTAEFTAGVVHRKRRMVRAAAYAEPRERSASEDEAYIVLAPPELPLIEQYQRLAPHA